MVKGRRCDLIGRDGKGHQPLDYLGYTISSQHKALSGMFHLGILENGQSSGYYSLWYNSVQIRYYYYSKDVYLIQLKILTCATPTNLIQCASQMVSYKSFAKLRLNPKKKNPPRKEQNDTAKGSFTLRRSRH